MQEQALLEGLPNGQENWHFLKVAILSQQYQTVDEYFFLSQPFDGEGSLSKNTVLGLKPLPALEGLDWGTWVKDLADTFPAVLDVSNKKYCLNILFPVPLLTCSPCTGWAGGQGWQG